MPSAFMTHVGFFYNHLSVVSASAKTNAKKIKTSKLQNIYPNIEILFMFKASQK